MDRKHIFLFLCIALIVVLYVEPSFCDITNAQIKAASKSLVADAGDWSKVIVGAGLMAGAASLFFHSYAGAVASVAGTIFVVAAKAYTGTGEAALVNMAEHFLRVVS